MIEFPIYVDDAVDIRLLRPQDTLEHYTLLAANRDHIAPHLPWAADATLQNQHNRIESYLKHYQQGNGFAASISFRTQRAGEITADRSDDTTIELHVWLDKYHTGRGIMIRALDALVTALLAEDNIDSVTMLIARTNKPARHLAEGLDFRKESDPLHPHHLIYTRTQPQQTE